MNQTINSHTLTQFSNSIIYKSNLSTINHTQQITSNLKKIKKKKEKKEEEQLRSKRTHGAKPCRTHPKSQPPIATIKPSYLRPTITHKPAKNPNR